MGGPQESPAHERTEGTRSGEEAAEHALRLGQDGELALEGLTGPPQQRLDGPISTPSWSAIC